MDVNDEMFLKNVIIRYPSASAIREPPTANQITSNRNSWKDKGQLPYKSHFNDQRDDHCVKMDRHISDISEYLDKAYISKNKVSRSGSSILKNSNAVTSASHNPSKNFLNEVQRYEKKNATKSNCGDDVIFISDEDDQQAADQNNNNKASDQNGGSGDAGQKKEDKTVKFGIEKPVASEFSLRICWNF